MYELKIIGRFAAAHQLKMVAKKCENLHGHNWKIEVCLAGKELNSAGVLMDFGQLKIILSEILLSACLRSRLRSQRPHFGIRCRLYFQTMLKKNH